MNKQPTETQLKEFWEWCIPERVEANRIVEGLPNPALDLNNLFKYAVPKLRELYTLQHIDYDLVRNQVLIWYWIRHRPENPDDFTAKWGINKDPALALFWCIFSVIDKSPPDVV